MKEILRLSLPISVWLIGFSVLYGLQGLACSRHWPAGWEARPLLIAAWVVWVVVQGVLLISVLNRGPTSRQMQPIVIALAVTSLFAAVWTGMPVVATTLCS